MRILADLLSHTSDPNAPAIVQIQRVPVVGQQVAVNGKFVIPVPLGLDFPITAADYILDGAGNIDGGDVVSKGYAHLLGTFPQFGNVYFNPLLTSDHVAELVLDQSYGFEDRTLDPVPTFYPRFQTGREEGVSDDGQMPTHTAMMPNNATMTPPRPGLIITEPIDIGPYTLDCDANPVGTDEFMVYWKLYAFTVTEDIAADAGAHAGVNTPAYRMLSETDPEPADFSVWLTTDDGANWVAVDLLAPMGFCDKTTTVRLAFRNDSSDRIFLASYALLF